MPGRPVRGMVSPFSDGLLRTVSAVSPCAICQRMSPLFRSMALMRAYGGFMSGSPRTVSATAAFAAGGRGRAAARRGVLTGTAAAGGRSRSAEFGARR